MSKNLFSNATTAQAVAEMIRTGGTGMHRLGQLWIVLDPERRAKIEEALQSDFDTYREKAAQAPGFVPNLAQRAMQDVAAGDARN